MRWPRDSGPLGGICPECGGNMILQYSDHIHREYTCGRCGLVSSNGGLRSSAPKGDVQKVVDKVYAELSRDIHRIELQPFLGVVEKVCLKTYNGHFPIIKRAELSSWGYEIIGTKIIKVEK